MLEEARVRMLVTVGREKVRVIGAESDHSVSGKSAQGVSEGIRVLVKKLSRYFMEGVAGALVEKVARLLKVVALIRRREQLQCC